MNITIIRQTFFFLFFSSNYFRSREISSELFNLLGRVISLWAYPIVIIFSKTIN